MGKSGNPAHKEQFKGAFTVWSNSYGVPTGYGQQVKYLIDGLKRHGLDVANISNFGLEGKRDVITTPYGEVAHFPRSFHPYSQDSAPIDHMTFVNEVADGASFENVHLTLYDVWVLESPYYEQIRNLWSWVPIDHVTLPPKVKAWLQKDNVKPVAMAPFGQRILEAEGIDSVYVPHAIDTKTLRETYMLSSGQDVRDYWSSRDRFVVGMVAANKASGLVHRKAFNENLMAFSIFQKKHPDALLYLHTDASGSGIGWNLLELLRGLGVPPTAVSVVNPVEYRYGSKVEDLAAYYSGMDVLLATSMGEGFGVPTIEAQSVGTRVIGSSWAATPDLVSEECWTVPGNPMWDDNQRAWWQNPQVPAIVEALEQAYAQGKTKAPSAVEFAKRFDVDYVWKNDWMPLLRGQFNDR